MAMPKSPVAINLVDVGGALALMQKPIENFRTANPELVSRITFTKAPAPELPASSRHSRMPGASTSTSCSAALDIVSAGNEQKLWAELLPKYADMLPKLEAIYLPGALDMQELGKGGAMCMVYYPRARCIEYAPEKVKTPPAPPRNCSPGRRPIRTSSSMRGRRIPGPGAPS